MVIASDCRIPDPTRVWSLLERRKSALAETIELRKIVYITNQIESINFQL